MNKQEIIRQFAILEAVARFGSRSVANQSRVSRRDVEFALGEVEAQCAEIRDCIAIGGDDEDEAPAPAPTETTREPFVLKAQGSKMPIRKDLE